MTEGAKPEAGAEPGGARPDAEPGGARPDAEPAASAGPDPERFLSGSTGDPGGRLARAARRLGDRLLDALAARAGGRLDELAASVPPRTVLVLAVYRGDGGLLPAAAAELSRSRHDVRFALGSMDDAAEPLAEHTAAAGLAGGKFENLNALLGEATGAGEAAVGGAAAGGEAAGGAAVDWTLVVDDDVALPRGFLDRLIGLAEHHGLALAQPAQSLASHAAWPHTRRRRGVARESRFVEIGPVTLFRRDALAELTPFPPLRFGWGLDLHWAAVAEQRGWRLGIADALAVRHEQARVAGTYSSQEAIEEARRFLADRPFLDAAAAQETKPLR